MIRDTVIEPPRGFAPLAWRDLVRHRELLGFLVWRDVIVRYKQTALGAAWAVLQAGLTIAVFTVLFGRLAGIDSEGVPYAVFSIAGVLPWLYFQNAVTHAANSLVANQRLVTKVWFPRVFLPMASTAAALVDYAIAGVLLVGICAWHGVSPGAEILALPLAILGAVVAANGAGMLLGALNVRYRDVRHVTPFLLQLWMFATPVIYPPKLLPEGARSWLALNPMAGFVDAHRAAILPDKVVDWGAFGVSAAAAAVLWVVGAVVFRRAERTFADVI